MIEPTPEEWRGWLDQSVGKAFKVMLEDSVQDLKDSWASGDFTGEDTEATIQLNSEALGKVQQIAEILLTLEEKQKDEEPEESTEY